MKNIFNQVFNQINVISLIIFIGCNSCAMRQSQLAYPGRAVRATAHMDPKSTLTTQNILSSEKILQDARESFANLIFQELQKKDLAPQETAKIIYCILFYQSLKKEDIVKLLTLASPIFSQMPEQDQQTLNFFKAQINFMPTGKPIDINYQFGDTVRDSLLFRAARTGDLHTTKILRDLGADILHMYTTTINNEIYPNAPTIWTPNERNDRKIVTTLLDAGYNPNTILHVTVKNLQLYGQNTGRKEHIESIIQILINHPQTDINFRVQKTDGTFTCPPIYYAIFNGLFEVVRMMRLRGANMNMKCSFLNQEHKDTPLELFKRLRTDLVGWYNSQVETNMEKVLTTTIDKLI